MTGLEIIATRLAQKGVQSAVARLIELQGQQVEQLAAIDAKLSALLVGPYKAGMRHLESALQDGIDDARRTSELDKARDRFIDSHDQLDHEPITQSHAAVLAAGTSILLSYPITEPQRWLARAHVEVATGILIYCLDVNRKAERRQGVTTRMFGLGNPRRYGAPRFASIPSWRLQRRVKPRLNSLYIYLLELEHQRLVFGVPPIEVERYYLRESHSSGWEIRFEPELEKDAFHHATELKDEASRNAAWKTCHGGTDLLNRGDLLGALSRYEETLAIGPPAAVAKSRESRLRIASLRRLVSTESQ
jgi:hypothetical protein